MSTQTVTDPQLIATWHQRYGVVLDDLDTAGLTVHQTAHRLTAYLDARENAQPGRRALQTALDRVSFALRRAARIPPIPSPETERRFRAGLASWLDALSALRGGVSDLNIEQLHRGLRAADAANSDLLAAQRSLRQLRRAGRNPPASTSPRTRQVIALAPRGLTDLAMVDSDTMVLTALEAPL
jgi:hypothetical protein